MSNRTEQIKANARMGLIGSECSVLTSSDPNFIGVSGIVINETAKTVIIKTNQHQKVVPKVGKIFKIKYTDNSIVTIEGAKLIGLPHKKIKKFTKNW